MTGEPFGDRQPYDEDDASHLHASKGDSHQRRTIYTGDDGLKHVRCPCGWDSANWETQP